MKTTMNGAWNKALAAIAACVIIVGAGAIARAQPSDPAAAQVEAFDASLIETMKAGKALGYQGRVRKLDPVVRRAFDIPTMIRFAVGPSWPSLSAADQQSLTNAFARLTTAGWARNFDDYEGERFEVDPKVVTRGPDKVVTTRLIPPHDPPTTIMYRMRQSGGAWKIIDVYYNGAISELTTRRADFASTLTKGGAPALVAHLNALADKGAS
jgi:phospholipid transport system substrate-binding protein